MFMKNKEILDFVEQVVCCDCSARIYDFWKDHKSELTSDQDYFLNHLFIMLCSLNKAYELFNQYGKD